MIFFCVHSKTEQWETQVKLGQPFLLIRLELKYLGLKNIFRCTFMTLLNIFYFTNFSLCQFKKRSTRKLRLSQVSHFDPHGWHSNFWASKIFQVFTYYPSETFFILKTFLCVNSKYGALGNLGYVRFGVLTLTAGIKIFGPLNFFQLYIHDPS